MVCPLCAARLQQGLGHACSNVGPAGDQYDGLEFHGRKLAWALLGVVGRRTRDPRRA